jgi:hypothetical protein
MKRAVFTMAALTVVVTAYIAFGAFQTMRSPDRVVGKGHYNIARTLTGGL